jgi:PAS domain S-box-containing protein
VKTPLRILLLEDDTRDAGLIQDVLEADNFACDVIRTQTRAEFLAALDDDAIDLILADYTLPSFDGLSALMLASSARSDLPFIFVSGTLGDEVAVEALKVGATDYILKTGMSRLVPSVQRALREARVRAERKKAAEAARGQHEAVKVKTPLRILLLEDDPQDAMLIQELLETDHFVCEINCVQTRAEFLAGLRSGGIDLILADYQLPSFDGLSALELARSERHDLPFIFVSGMIGEETAVDALRIGATDYILKPRLARLVPAVQRALREARERAERRVAAEAARRSEKELLDVIEAIPTMAFITLADGGSVWVNRRWVEYTGLSVDSTSGGGWRSTVHPDDFDGHINKWQASIASGEPFENEARHRSANGEYRWFLVRAVSLRDESGRIRKWYGTLTDIEDRKRAEQERERLRQLEADLAYMNREMTMGELAASLAHELKQPMAAATNDANACMQWLCRDTPDLTEACEAASATIADVTRAAEIIDRVRSLYRRGTPLLEPFN